jgi:malate/lactate dehydrogenase
MLQQLGSLNRRAITICAGGDHRRLIERGVAETSLLRRRLIGSAPLALQTALRAIIAVELQCSSRDVSLAVLGAPPDRFVIPWSEASVRGVALSRLLSSQRLALLQQKIVRVWPPGPYTLAAATAQLCESVIQGTGIYGVTCYVVLDGELGVRGRAVATAVTIDASGVTSVTEPSLSVRERVLLDNALHG